MQDILKSIVIQLIYEEAQRPGNPVFCIVDDTISSKTKPSLRALHPIEDAYFHRSYLKGKQDYGHHAVAVILSCNGIVLNYAIFITASPNQLMSRAHLLACIDYGETISFEGGYVYIYRHSQENEEVLSLIA